MIHALGATLLTAFIIAIPFQELAKVCHHSTSDHASRFRRMKWSRWLAVVDKSMSLCRKALSDRTALHAHMRERTYEGQQFPLSACFPPPQEWSRNFRLASLSPGRRISRASESSSMPRKRMQDAGPSHLSKSRAVACCHHCGQIVLTFI